MKILSIDASTKSTGYALFNDKKLEKYGLITASSNDLIKRIQKITDELRRVLETYKDIDKIILEEVRPENSQYGVGNLQTHRALMYLLASFAFMIHESFPNILIELVYPSSWRSACGIKTGAGIRRETLKAADIKFANETFALNIDSDDIADAICIGYGYIKNLSTLPRGVAAWSKK